MFDGYWAMLGGASATISGLAFVSTTIFYNKLYTIARYSKKIGLEGNITQRFIVRVSRSFCWLISPLIIVSILFITHIDTFIDCRLMPFINVLGLLFLLIGLIDVFKSFFYYDTNIAHFTCSQKYVNIVTENKKQLEEKVKETYGYFESLTVWLEMFEAKLSHEDKVVYGNNKDFYVAIIYGDNENALSKRYTAIISSIEAITTNGELSYKKVVELTDMYEDIVTDVDKTKGQLRTIVRGLANKNDEWKAFFQSRHPDLSFKKNDECCK